MSHGRCTVAMGHLDDATMSEEILREKASQSKSIWQINLLAISHLDILSPPC
jgi:hypothetical protein